MSKTYPIIERLADEVIVTARSTVEAQQAAGEAMGGDCTIVSVERVREGGIGGFFSTELVRVTARPSRFHRADRELDAAMTSAEELVSSLRSSSPQFADRLMDELLHHRPEPQQADDTAEIHLPADALAVIAELNRFEEQAAPLPTAAAPPVAPRGASPAVTPSVSLDRVARDLELERRLAEAIAGLEKPTPAPVELPRGNYGNPERVPAIVAGPTATARQADPRWSHETLRALGIPDRMVDLAVSEQPVDGPQWIMALMGAFRTICAPPPAGPTVLVGPACANLARQLRLVSVGADELSESLSSVAIPNVSAGVARSALNDRFVHLMVGGSWQHLSSIRPDIVSAATDAELLEAVRVCCAWGATLGWTQIGDRYERIDEFTLVSHIRSILYGIDRPASGGTTVAAGSGSPVSPDAMMATFS
jgi:hypothetical protein